jgi:hypothetical protein
MAKTLVVGVAFAAALTEMLVGCGGSTKTVTVTSPAAATHSRTTAERSRTPVPRLPARAVSGGIEIRVLKVYALSSLRYEGGTQSELTPDAQPRRVTAPQGGRYVYVRAIVKNNTSAGIDLTCGYPVDAKLIDAAGRAFDPDSGLYQLAGNPGCNDLVQPGFRAAMRWVYLVPRGAVATEFEFSDVSDIGSPAAVAAIPLPPR